VADATNAVAFTTATPYFPGECEMHRASDPERFTAPRFERFRCVVVQQDRAPVPDSVLLADCDATRDEIDLIPSQQSDLI